MKASFEPVSTSGGNSFVVRRFKEEAFSAPYHYHPEYELTLILKGEGKRYVGTSLAPYEAGDLVLLGPNLPHCWKSENIKKDKLNATSVVVQFLPDFLGERFLEAREMFGIARILTAAADGVQFAGDGATVAKRLLLRLERETNPFRRAIVLLETLECLAGCRKYVLLDKQQKLTTPSLQEHKKINDVMAYIVDNFREEITLEKAARVAGMTTTAFCRYFKRETRRNFMQTVMEYRINYAAQQLVNTDKRVSDVSFESGFGDVSHFYKTFKKQKQLSPRQYRQKFTRELA